MKCRKAIELLHDYVSGVLLEHAHRDLQEHVKQCDKCETEMQSIKNLVANLQDLSGKQAPVDCWHLIRDKIQQKQVKAIPWWQKSSFRYAVAFSMVAVLFMLVVMLMNPFDAPDRPIQPVAKAPEYIQYANSASILHKDQPLVDPDLTFVAAEMERVSFASNSVGR